MSSGCLWEVSSKRLSAFHYPFLWSYYSIDFYLRNELTTCVHVGCDWESFYSHFFSFICCICLLILKIRMRIRFFNAVLIRAGLLDLRFPLMFRVIASRCNYWDLFHIVSIIISENTQRNKIGIGWAHCAWYVYGIISSWYNTIERCNKVEMHTIEVIYNVSKYWHLYLHLFPFCTSQLNKR